MRIGITGTRTLDDYEFLCHTLYDIVEAGDVIVTGNEFTPGDGNLGGVDRLTHRWCVHNDVPYNIHKPDFLYTTRQDGTQIHEGAITKRNRILIEDSDIVIAIWDGKSEGTKDIIQQAVKTGKPLFVYSTQNKIWMQRVVHVMGYITVNLEPISYRAFTDSIRRKRENLLCESDI